MRGELVGEDRLGVVEEAADQRALAVVDAAGGEKPQHAVVEHVADPRSPTSEIAFLLAQLHRRVVGLVVEARRAALGDRRRGGLGDDRFDRRARSMPPAPCT